MRNTMFLPTGPLPFRPDVYAGGGNKSFNQAGHLYYATANTHASSPCNSSSAVLYIDLRGYKISSISYNIDVGWYNAQPRQGTYADSGNGTITYTSNGDTWFLDGTWNDVDTVNLFTIYGATNTVNGFSRTITYNTPREDLLLQLGSFNCQASGSRFIRVNSVSINGKSMLSIEGTSGTSANKGVFEK